MVFQGFLQAPEFLAEFVAVLLAARDPRPVLKQGLHVPGKLPMAPRMHNAQPIAPIVQMSPQRTVLAAPASESRVSAEARSGAAAPRVLFQTRSDPCR